MRYRNGIVAATAVAALALTGAGCSSGHASQSAAAAASSLAADPTYQAQVKQLENELLANFQKYFDPHHPITSMESAVEHTFPGASASTIVSYAVKTFKLADRKRGPDQDAWMHGVVTYALAQGTQGVPSGAASVPIPGVTASVPTPSPSSS